MAHRAKIIGIGIAVLFCTVVSSQKTVAHAAIVNQTIDTYLDGLSQYLNQNLGTDVQSGSVTGIIVKASNASTNSVLTFELSTSTNFATVAVTATSTQNINDADGSNTGFVSFTFPSAYTFVSGQNYCFRIYSGGSNWWRGGNNSNNYQTASEDAKASDCTTGSFGTVKDAYFVWDTVPSPTIPTGSVSIFYPENNATNVPTSILSFITTSTASIFQTATSSDYYKQIVVYSATSTKDVNGILNDETIASNLSYNFYSTDLDADPQVADTINLMNGEGSGATPLTMASGTTVYIQAVLSYTPPYPFGGNSYIIATSSVHTITSNGGTALNLPLGTGSFSSKDTCVAGAYSVWEMADWLCFAQNFVAYMGGKARDLAGASLSVTYSIFGNIFPLSIYTDINTDINTAIATSTPHDIVLSGAGLWGGHTITLLTSSTTSGISSHMGFDYRGFLTKVFYLITGLTIGLTTVAVISKIHHTT